VERLLRTFVDAIDGQGHTSFAWRCRHHGSDPELVRRRCMGHRAANTPVVPV